MTTYFLIVILLYILLYRLGKPKKLTFIDVFIKNEFVNYLIIVKKNFNARPPFSLSISFFPNSRNHECLLVESEQKKNLETIHFYFNKFSNNNYFNHRFPNFPDALRPSFIDRRPFSVLYMPLQISS